MKKLFLLTAIIAVFGLSSCEKEPSKAIVGKWEAVTMETSIAGINMTIDMVDAGMKMEFTFDADGSGSLYLESEGIGERVEFEYYVNDNMLFLTNDGETEGVPVSLDQNTMTMELDGNLIGDENSKFIVHLQKV